MTKKSNSAGRRIIIKFPGDEVVGSTPNMGWPGAETLSVIEKDLGLIDAKPPRELGQAFRPSVGELSAELRKILKAAGFPNVDYGYGSWRWKLMRSLGKDGSIRSVCRCQLRRSHRWRQFCRRCQERSSVIRAIP